MAARCPAVDHAVSSGTFTLDGETFDVDNNIWVVGDDDECVVIDAPHSVDDILAVVGGRKVKAILLHPRPRRPRAGSRRRCARRWSRRSCCTPTTSRCGSSRTPDHLWDLDLADGWEIEVGGTTLPALHTPGHAPGAVCFLRADLGCVFTGDTLFQGGPGATGRSYSATRT